MSDTTVIENRGKIEALEDRVSKIEERMDRMATDITDIKTKLLNRPTPVMTTLIAILTCVASVAATWALTVLNLVIQVG